VSLQTLIRGMMYPSGNDAAWAIARHVAEAYLGPGATGEDFVAMMNQHAAAEGLVDTHFTSPNGWDDPASASPAPNELNHYTTARELAKLMAHAIQDPYFQQVVGFQGTYTDTTTGAPSGTKTYSSSWGFNYPGWEGAKGGGTLNCNGPNNGCMAMSAKRIGRRVVLAYMQGLPWTEEPGMFDYGFATLFHPDPHGTSVAAGNAADHDLTCLIDGRAVSAVIPQSGDARRRPRAATTSRRACRWDR
jgi:serine-type D-Ala-D-Ala carboxypeptidase (penicillin-binding protein 5/6)